MRDLVKRIVINRLRGIVGFFSGKYSKRTTNKSIANHIGTFCSRKRLNASIVEINVLTIPLEHEDFISVEVICDKPGRLIGMRGSTSAELSAELSLLVNSRVELCIKKFVN